ncbi:SIMPL domain-containing protein [Paracoccus aerodenitrificans]|uniref:SIMPL domain-containing protein n=1 Tax=Paracoccus aerodenitrificans TaxID=3017781 RepID=UPI0022F03D93|nr:SIMPL domain-containing protein [Paracoccus aerodenitrificans]WBU63076.1 SIMPL domain-containing protein [Paracoccus aerodenitrificans]
MTSRGIFSLRSALVGGVCAAALAGPALAAPGAQGGCGHPGMLTITGNGESRVSPDQVMISLGVTTQADTAAQAMQDNSSRQQAVLDTLTGAGVEAADIQTSGLTLNPMMQYPEDGAAPSIDGYMAQNMLTVRVTDIARVGEVLDSIVEAGANEMQGIRFIREDSQTSEDEALSLAVADARHRAEVMAEAAGVELGRIVRMGEPEQNVMAPNPAMMRAMDSAGQAKSIPVEGGEVAFTSAVEVTFALIGDESCEMPKPGPETGQPEAPSPEAAMPEPAAPAAPQPDPAADPAAPDVSTGEPPAPEPDAPDAMPAEPQQTEAGEAGTDQPAPPPAN